MTNPSGIIASVDEDSNGMYDNSLVCSWTIRLSIDKVIALYFREMDVHRRSSRCEEDFLEVWLSFSQYWLSK